MNALDMKLESTSLIPGNMRKGIWQDGKSCKNNRKKVNPLCFDSDNDKESVESKDARRSADKIDFIPKSKVDVINFKKRKVKNFYCDGNMMIKAEKVQDRLEESLSDEAKRKISSIINEIKVLSDVEKLLLYLQLPTGSTTEEDPLKQKPQNNPLGKKADEEGTLAVSWIHSHLEEDPDVSLPKQEVYDEYQSFCEITGNEALCAADFGKVMKQVFPSVKPRRLGTRGNSRYCYSGLKKKAGVPIPSLPDLQIEKDNCKSYYRDTEEISSAACHVLFEWTEKLLGNKFTSLKDLASYLIENVYVDNRSVAAFTVLLSSSPEKIEKGSLKCETKNKKSETQIHLQRKIQEREHIKEQKKKLEEQRALLTAENEKPSHSKKKIVKNRKLPLQSACDETFESIEAKESLIQAPTKTNEVVASDSESLICNKYGLGSSTESSEEIPRIITDENLKFCELSQQLSNAVLTVGDVLKRKPKNKIPKTAVCVAKSLPSFIIVPSLSQVQLKDVGVKTCNKTQHKYKRIQPKLLNDFSTSAVMRNRTRSLGSAMLKELKPSQSEGRRSSLALLHSDAKFEIRDSKNSTNRKSDVSKSKPSFIKTSLTSSTAKEQSTIECLQDQCSVSVSPNSEKVAKSFFDPIKNLNIDLAVKDRKLLLKPDSCTKRTNESATSVDDMIGTKRHSEETFEVVNKKPHLEELFSSDVSSESLSPWSRDISDINCSLSSNFLIQDSNDAICKKEVSIHELESDALIDYLHGTNVPEIDFNSSNKMPDVKNELCENSDDQDILSSDKHLTNPEVSELSQLRMLLEQNLPHTVTKAVRIPNEMTISSKKSSVLMHTNDLVSPLAISESKGKRELLFGTGSEPGIYLRNVNSYFSNARNDTSSDVFSNTKESSPQIISDQELLTVISQPFCSSIAHLRTRNSEKGCHNIDGSNASGTSNVDHLCNVANVELNSTQTQVPSVPPSPNTRRRAFNFMPISPRHTPIPEGSCAASTHPCYSPVPIQLQRNTVSVGVGPSQPPSNSGSPFVSPRSTPIPPSRSRHSSGQSTYSTSRHTPFQNFDSGVSSISSSPFISPQPTPIPVSRLRHNSSHGSFKTVTFSSVNSNQVVQTPTAVGSSALRLRHSSGPSGPHVGFSILSPRSAPLSPLVSEHVVSNFNFPVANDLHGKHNSGIAITSLSPVSEQVSGSSNSSNLAEMSSAFGSPVSSVDPFIGDNSAKEMIGFNVSYKQTRQRHASSSVIYTKPSIDPLAQEVQRLFKEGAENLCPVDSNSRSHSVPLHQMLQTLPSTSFQFSEELKSYTSNISQKQNVLFPMLVSNPTLSTIPISSENLILHCNKSLQPIQNEWGTSDMEISTLRRNLVGILEAPIGDDLQTTLEDLRDCDTDFSKFAQELEEFSQNKGQV